MLPRERISETFAHRIPDRMPVYADYVPEVQDALMKHFHKDDYYEMCVEIGNDMLMVSGDGIGSSFYGPEEEYVCRWGCTWRQFRNKEGHYTEIVDAPLWDDEDGEKLEKYQIPSYERPEVYENARRVVEKYGKTHWICGSITCSIFECAWYLHGLEDTTCDMIVNPDYMNKLFDKVMEHPLQTGLRFIDCGVDMLWLGDDVGMQERMLISPEMWRKYLKPRMKKLISAFKAKNPNIVVAYHSCGYIEPIIGELADIGLDVLNPIQPLAMDPAVIKERYGDRLSFWGAIDIQETLPRGSIEDIRNEVLLRKNTIGKNGGYLCSPAHTIQADTSLEHVLAFYQAVRELGNY